VPLPAPRIASGTAPKATSIVENEITAPAESAGVRAALARYEAAYSGLDASAARAVWPTVDERALARAFDGLAAQRLSLGNCDVRVNGDTAHAICAGRAAWTPKIGAGQRSATRQWSFDLRHADGAWYIYRVLMF
jgi:hypothetical protein